MVNKKKQAKIDADKKKQLINQLLNRYFTLSYKLDAMPKVLIAAKQEHETYLATIDNAERINATLIHCTKTGQPIGQLFNHCVDTYLPHAIAPNWINTSEKVLNDKLEQQPIALLAYLIDRYGFKSADDRIAYYELIEQKQLRTIQIVQLEAEVKRSLYSTLVEHNNIDTIINILYAVSEFISFIGYKDIVYKTTEQVFQAVQAGEIDTILPLIHSSYTSHVEGLLTIRELNEVKIMDDGSFIDYWSKILTRASNRINTTAANPVNKLTPLIRTASRKQTASTREQVKVKQAVNQALTNEIMDAVTAGVNAVKTGPVIGANKPDIATVRAMINPKPKHKPKTNPFITMLLDKKDDANNG